MRRRTLTPILLLAACNSLLGIHELPPDAAVVADAAIDGPVPALCGSDGDCADPYAVCLPTGACGCSAGYAVGSGSGSACAFVGIVADPGFDQTGTPPWQVATGAMIFPGRNGDLDVGTCVMQALPATCDVPPQITQAIVMPRAARSERLALVSTYQSVGGFAVRAAFAEHLGSIWYEGSLKQSESDGTWVTSCACLGAAQYAPATSTGSGAAMTLVEIEDTENNACTGSAVPVLTLDHTEIKSPSSAPECTQTDATPLVCPGVGEVVNGDVESPGGWQFSSGIFSPAPASQFTAIIAPGSGEAGTAGIYLAALNACDFPVATTPASVPLAGATGGPLLRGYHASATDSIVFHLGGMTMQLPHEGSAGGSASFCISPALAGGVFPFAAELDTSSPSSRGSATGCGPIDVSGVADNIVLATDLNCIADRGVADPGFESGYSVSDGSALLTTLRVNLDTDGPTGSATHELQMTTANTCGTASYNPFVVVPLAVGSAGPAIAFDYHTPNGGPIVFSVMSYGSAFTPTADGTWHHGVACLDPRTGDRPQHELFQFTGPGSGSDCATIANQTLSLDNLETLTAVGCPTQ